MKLVVSNTVVHKPAQKESATRAESYQAASVMQTQRHQHEYEPR